MPKGNAIAYPDSSKLIVDDQTARLIKAADLSPTLAALLTSPAEGNRLNAAGRQWIVARSSMQEGGPQGLQLALLVPEDELLVDAYRMRWQGALITLATLLLCLPMGWLTSRILVKPLRALVQEADAIRSFDFNFPPSRRSPVLEVDQLSVSMARMKDTLASFFQITDSLSAETRFAPLLQRVLFETVKIGQAQAGLIYLRESDGDRMEPHGAGHQRQFTGIAVIRHSRHTRSGSAEPCNGCSSCRTPTMSSPAWVSNRQGTCRRFCSHWSAHGFI